jgi:hypothetical protein
MKEVAEHISPELAEGVYLKRGCTEMELKFGNSRLWEWKDDFERWEKIYRDHFYVHKETYPQPPFLREHILLQWLKHATNIGDKSAEYYNDFKPLYATMQKYYQYKKGEK